MRNILALFADDARHLFTNAMSVIITLGLVLMPSIFAWYNILAAWDVFGNTGNLKVAVANVDEGYKSDLIPIQINVGEQVISALRANDDIDWEFTSEEEAIDGAKAGRYYAAVVIPESFSRDMLTFYSDDVEHANIVYYANEKKNAVAPKITAQGADSVSYQVNQVFVETLSELAVGLAEGLSSTLDDDALLDNVGSLSSSVRTAADEVTHAVELMELYASLADSAQALTQSSAGLIGTAETSLSQGMSAAEQGVSSLTSLAGTLQSAGDGLSQALANSASGFSSVESELDTLFDDASSTATLSVEQMRAQATAASDQAAQLRVVADALEDMEPSVPSDYQAAFEAMVSRLRSSADLMDLVASNLNDAADGLENGTANIQQERDEAKRSAAEAKKNLEAVQADFDTNVKPGLEALASDAAELSDKLLSAGNTLGNVGSELSGSVGSVGSTLGGVAAKIRSSASSLSSVSDELRGLADKIDAALAAADAEQLRAILGADAQALASALSAPVGIERSAIYPVETFGSAMAPLYTTLALFIGGLLILVALKPSASSRAINLLENPKPRQLFFGHFGVMGLLSLAQSTLMALGNLLFVQVQVAHPVLFFLCYWVAGLVFTFIIYALVVSFANLGKALAVLLLIVQVTGCGGSFPLQLLPQFIQMISPFLPATHVVNAMRAAMFGVYQNDFWVSLGIVLLFLIPFLLLGLVLRKPLEKFMDWYVTTVESTKVIG